MYVNDWNAGVQARSLLDTGALLAYLDSNDAWHARCVNSFVDLRLPLGTTAAVLTELFHLVGENPREIEAAWRFIRSDVITVLPIGDPDLSRIEHLMRTYADCPMDFADATLVYAAERESISTVFTIDNNDFETYRIHGRSRFHVLPGRV